jgi:hypothetical protein
MSNQPVDPDNDLMRGAERIAAFIYQDDSPQAVRRLYHEASRLPVFQNVKGGPLHALKSRLLKHFEALSIVKERQIAEAAQPPAAPSATPRSHLQRRKPARVVARRAREPEEVG